MYSLRYQAAFSGYAAALLGMRTPAYPGLTGKILADTIQRLVDRRAWQYIASYWADKPWFPDPCGGENIMYSGHLLQLLAMYEAVTNDPRWRTAGFDFVWDKTRRVHHDTMSLVETTVRQMRANPSGGVCCEPGLIFFMCNNHPQVALRLLEGLGLGDWSADRRKWEEWAMASYRSLAGGGQFKILYHQKSGGFVPFGHPAGDGWSLLWYAPWARDPELVRRIWQASAAQFDWGKLEQAHTESEKGTGSCCQPQGLDAPLAPVVSFLAPAARACGDAESATRLEAWLDKHFRTSANGVTWLNTLPKWRIAVTANRIIALALQNGSDLRALVQRPLPRDYFAGPLLEEVRPATVPVYQAWRDGNDLLVEFDGGGETVHLQLANLPALERLEGLPPGAAWSLRAGILEIPGAGRLRLRLVPAPDPGNPGRRLGEE